MAQYVRNADEPTLAVLLDPGHGGRDTGATWEDDKTGALTFEKDLNLAVAKLVVAKLPEYIRVHMSRRKDDYVSLRERAVTTYHYDLMVSIHCNAVGDPARQKVVHGAEVWVTSTKDLVLRGLAGEFLRCLEDQGVKGNVSNPIRVNPKLRVLVLADKRRDRFGRSPSSLRPSKDPRYGEKGVGVPAVLLELGYMTHAKNLKALKTKAYQEKIADAIAMAIILLAPKAELCIEDNDGVMDAPA